jgi:hypothetical protein
VQFRKFGYTTSPTFKYCDLFLKVTEILILNIRSERQGSWNMHLSSIASMLPYLFIANRVNYSRYLPVYILDMLDLHQDVKSAFESGVLVKPDFVLISALRSARTYQHKSPPNKSRLLSCYSNYSSATF